MLPLTISALIGALLGAALGRMGKCATGACPLTATWWRGALFGGVVAVLFYVAAGGPGASTSFPVAKHLKAVRPTEFDAELKAADIPVVVDFYATWCTPCKLLTPTLDELAGRFAGRIKFLRVDLDQAPALAARFEISGVPTLLLMRDGKVTDVIMGLESKSELEHRLERLLEPGPAMPLHGGAPGRS